MSSKPLFSIIVPVYKVEKYIEKCISSVLNQTFHNYELILVDDGSPDNCPAICDKFAAVNENIKVIHKENGGVAAARKDALLTAKGEYCLCVDADDWISEECLQKIANEIKSSNTEIVCFNMTYETEKGSIVSKLQQKAGYYNRKRMEKEIFPILIQQGNAAYFSPSLCNKAIKRELLVENFLADRLVTIGEDGACVIPCIYHAKSISIIEDSLYYYRYNPESATKRGVVFNWSWPRIVAEHIESKMPLNEFDFNEQMARKIVHDVFSVAVTQFNQKKSYRNITQDIRKHLDEDIYQEAISESKFNGSIKAQMMKISLKYKWFLPIYLYSKM